MKKQLSPLSRAAGLAALALVSAGSLVACGGDDGDDAAASPSEGAVCDVTASPEDVAEAKESLAGETITFIVDRSPGGGYDQYARLVAPYIADELGATVVVENQEGAGGLVAMNALAKGNPDGKRIATFNAPGLVPAALAEYQGVQFEPSELTWLGRMAGEPDLVVVAEDSPIQTWDELIAAEGIKFGSTGPGAADYVSPAVLIDAFDMDAEIVTGYDGASETELGLLRGDVDAMTGTLDSRLPALENGTTRALAAITTEPLEALPEVPTVFETDIDETQEQILTSHIGIKDIGRPIVAPPGMEDAMTVAWRETIDAVLANPELLAEAEKVGRPIGYLSGADQCQLAQNLLDAPEEYRQALKAAYAGGTLD